MRCKAGFAALAWRRTGHPKNSGEPALSPARAGRGTSASLKSPSLKSRAVIALTKPSYRRKPTVAAPSAEQDAAKKRLDTSAEKNRNLLIAFMAYLATATILCLSVTDLDLLVDQKTIAMQCTAKIFLIRSTLAAAAASADFPF